MLSLIAGIFLLFCCNTSLWAEEVYLRNQDKITGEIMDEDEDSISIRTEAMGVVSVDKRFIERIRGREETKIDTVEGQGEIIWDRNVSLGFARSSGNTDTSNLSANLFINRNRKHVDERTLKWDFYYSSSNKKMDVQKWYGAGRYAFSFGSGKRWYNFYKLEADHDRFANVDYRLIPSLGIGHWFYDLEEMKAMVELAGGYEWTDFRDATDENKEAVLIPRAYLERRVFKKSKWTQDLALYPVFEDFSDYRLRSETIFSSPISEKVSINFSLIDEYNSEPPGDTKKNDFRIISSLSYSF